MNLPRIRMGIDLGGTKIAAKAFSADTLQVLKATRVPTPSDYSGLLVELKRLVEAFRDALGSLTVGICHPGSTRASGLIQNANIIWLNNRAFQHDLESLLGQEVKSENDANCFTLSEAVDGAAKGANVVFGATIGTGLGGGWVINQQLQTGRNRIAGEWGHINLPWPSQKELPGPRCYCGLEGCLETFISGTALAKHFHQVSGQSLTAEQVVGLAEQGDAKAEACLQMFEDRLARACALVMNMVDPDVIVLGGGVSSVQRLYKNVPQLWDRYAFSLDPIRTQLVQAAHGGDSGVRGAAYLWG